MQRSVVSGSSGGRATTQRTVGRSPSGRQLVVAPRSNSFRTNTKGPTSGVTGTATRADTAPPGLAGLAPEDTAADVPAVAGAGPSSQRQLPRTIRQLKLRSAACYLPHPDKEHYGGEDAHFLSAIGGGALGVADGVGGWGESGINPADYSRTFMRVAHAFVEGGDPVLASRDENYVSPGASPRDSPTGSLDGPAVADVRAALDTAHKLTRLPGSATACVLALDPETRSLRAANLGDSGFIVLKRGAVALRSRSMQHVFDCPLQFGAYPEHVEATDTAEEADIYQVRVEPSDIIIAGSDGLWDNVYETDLLKLAPRSSSDAQAAAQRIARLAREHASDETYESPYIREARRAGYDIPWWSKVLNSKVRDGKLQLGELSGGKMDDITVLVAVVEEEEVVVGWPGAETPSIARAANAAGAAAGKAMEEALQAALDSGVVVAADEASHASSNGTHTQHNGASSVGELARAVAKAGASLGVSIAIEEEDSAEADARAAADLRAALAAIAVTDAEAAAQALALANAIAEEEAQVAAEAGRTVAASSQASDGSK